MCGIAGLVRRTGRSEPDRLTSMIEALHSRGPDGTGRFEIEGLAMGMRRLAILDIEGGDQPMQDASGRITVVFNGEIYGYRELRADLEEANCVFRTSSDTEVLVHGYATWGLDGLLARLDGMFAFALHDATSDELHIARDGLGIKPLLYVERDGEIAFASSYASLIQSGLVDLEPDADAIRQFLYLQFVPGTATVLRSVRRLAAGHVMTLRGGEIVTRPRAFWSIPERNTVLDEATWHERLRSTWSASIERHLRSDVDVAVFLSGGFDSSLVLAEASRQRGRTITAYSIAMDATGAWDESPHAQHAAERFDAELQTLRFGPREILELCPRVGELMDEPLGDAACLPTLLLSEVAARNHKVVLTGEGADELFAGYDYYRSFERAQRRSLLAPLKNFVKRRMATEEWHAGSSPRSGFPYALAPVWIDRALRDLPGRDPAAAIADLERRVVAEHANLSPLDEALRVDASYWLTDDLLVKLDRSTMAYSLEGRVPFLDRALVELAFTMPGSFKRNQGQGKAILRECFGATLGESLTSRSKHGFDLPLAQWIRTELRDIVTDRLRETAACPWLDTSTIERMLDAHQQNAASLERALWSLFSLVSCFEHWKKALPA